MVSLMQWPIYLKFQLLRLFQRDFFTRLLKAMCLNLRFANFIGRWRQIYKKSYYLCKQKIARVLKRGCSSPVAETTVQTLLLSPVLSPFLSFLELSQKYIVTLESKISKIAISFDNPVILMSVDLSPKGE